MESIKFIETGNLKQCNCELINSCYTYPLTSFFGKRGINRMKLANPKHYRVALCETCKGITVFEQKHFEPSIYDLPKYLFTLTFSLCSESKDKSLKAFVSAVSKADFLKQRNVRQLKMEQLDKNLADYGIEWE